MIKHATCASTKERISGKVSSRTNIKTSGRRTSRVIQTERLTNFTTSNQVVLRDIVAELFPDECTTDPKEGCALVDYGYQAPHETENEGPIIEKLRLHEKKVPEKTTLPLPSSIGNSSARHPARDVVSLLHPEVTIVAHLQALSMDTFFRQSRQKTKRRVARLKCFCELYKYPGFNVEGHDVTVRGSVISAMKNFVKSSFCKIVLGNDNDAINELYANVEEVFKRFGGKVSFAPLEY